MIIIDDAMDKYRAELPIPVISYSLEYDRVQGSRGGIKMNLASRGSCKAVLKVGPRITIIRQTETKQNNTKPMMFIFLFIIALQLQQVSFARASLDAGLIWTISSISNG